MNARIAIAFAVMVAVMAFSWWWRAREGRFTAATGRFDRADLGLSWRARPSAILVEFFGEHCAPCVTVQRRIEKLAHELPDVSVVSIDAGARLDLADRYGVRRVPTLFVADENLRISWRASGVPTEGAIRSALLGPGWTGRPHPDADSANRGARPENGGVAK